MCLVFIRLQFRMFAQPNTIKKYRNRGPEVFCKRGIPKNFAKITRKDQQ